MCLQGEGVSARGGVFARGGGVCKGRGCFLVLYDSLGTTHSHGIRVPASRMRSLVPGFSALIFLQTLEAYRMQAHIPAIKLCPIRPGHLDVTNKKTTGTCGWYITLSRGGSVFARGGGV